jgi:hypothetical protein
MAISTDDSRLGRLEGQMEQVAIMLQDMRAEIRSLNTRIDRLTLAILGIGGGVIVALISLVGVLAARITQSG